MKIYRSVQKLLVGPHTDGETGDLISLLSFMERRRTKQIHFFHLKLTNIYNWWLDDLAVGFNTNSPYGFFLYSAVVTIVLQQYTETS
jgi:hypothetical protein